MYKKISQIEPLSDLQLRAVFATGETKYYNVRPLIEKFPVFQDLINIEGLFKQVHLDAGGYGIAWSDNLDLDATEIFVNGSEHQ